MTEQELETGKALIFLIEKTEGALATLKDWIDNASPSVGGDSYEKDNHYSLYISENRDGSGIRLDLARYMGNTALLEVIQAELERQLAMFREDFANL